ncbi:virulence-associated E family protein [Vallitalea sp.]|uniref:virulence-associated E family protein n=1 Tax=Vallitalea sp. TaxID=1882829 RepID=UPI0025E4DA9D|nr:virulence-associated E family protein [Vallitalea sp.]MCT4686064.1 virulence-associated E family protein [Vallitalea sp.]
MKYDGEISIAVGRSRKETKWKNKEILWSELINKLSETTRTAETHNEYMASPRSRQAEIKDVGGFVGGYLNQGTRKADSVQNRTVITLDIDHAKADQDILDSLDMLYGCAAAIYSTHKHTPENPKLRLVIPINRPVFTDEYEAISRRIAGDLGINDFDDTTFQPSRLMYFPSTSKDGEYLFDTIDAPWLDADEVLNSYRDWKDSSSWPISDRVDKVVARNIKKQGDPLEKPGLIGAFCRCYTIHEAIEKYLQDDYEACVIENRYTYKDGSTAAGLVVYDDKFAFSHHGTDPSSGKLCNAFDLVRIHMFGLKDEDAAPSTPSNRLPSFKAMNDFVSNDESVNKQLGKEQLRDIQSDFDDDFEFTEDDTEWVAKLDRDTKGRINNTISNIEVILSNDPRIKGCIGRNKFSQKDIALKHLPWRKIDRNVASDAVLEDSDDARVRKFLEHYGNFSKTKIDDAVSNVTQDNAFHPIRDYLDKLKWDGEKRLDTLLIDYLGAEDSAYIRAVTRKSIVACVARVRHPGCKFDYVLTLVGKQGIGKSTILKKLGQEWFSDSFTTVQGKEATEQIQGYWLIEMGELAGLRKAETEQIKHFISKQTDIFRVAYGRRTGEFPRQCVFFGTTNNTDFLNDVTGNRRFWPVSTFITEPEKNMFKDLDQYEIDQIWAEAQEYYNKKEPLYLSAEIEAEARKVQEKHSKVDDRAGAVEMYLDTPVPSNWYDMDVYERVNYIQNADDLTEEGTMIREKICVLEIWVEYFNGQRKDLDRRKSSELHTIMKSLKGWQECGNKGGRMRIKGYGPQRAYERIKA